MEKTARRQQIIKWQVILGAGVCAFIAFCDLPGGVIAADAKTEMVEYIDRVWNETTKQVDETNANHECEVLTRSMLESGLKGGDSPDKATWYVLDESIKMNEFGHVGKGYYIDITGYVNIILKDDIVEYIKGYLKELTDLMGIKVEFETQKRESYIKVNMISDNNAILIGKNGRTMSSLQTLVKQSIQNKLGIRVNVILDANEYKQKQEKNIERLAIRLAKDVRKTKIEVKMDSMNSYERRLVHNVLTNFKGVTTISEGEEPNRYVIIKPTEE